MLFINVGTPKKNFIFVCLFKLGYVKKGNKRRAGLALRRHRAPRC